jgi:hypothetical protein
VIICITNDRSIILITTMIEQALNFALSLVVLYLDLGFYRTHKIESRTAALFRLHWLFGYVNLYEQGREYERALINLNLPNRPNYKHMLHVELRDIIKERVQHQDKLYKSSYK